MSVAPSIREVFGYFQNLNLLVLLQDLRDGRTARHAWLAGSDLCPIAHGMIDGQRVRHLVILGQSTELDEGCAEAARQLGANPDAVLRFVRAWDEEAFGQEWLLRQLDALWLERLEDAAVVQHLLMPAKCEDPHFEQTPCAGGVVHA